MRFQEGRRDRAAQGLHRKIRLRPTVIAVLVILIGHIALVAGDIYRPVEAIQVVVPVPATAGLIFAGKVHIADGHIQPQARIKVGDHFVRFIVDGILEDHEGVRKGEIPRETPLCHLDAQRSVIGYVNVDRKNIGVAGEVVLMGDGAGRIEGGQGILRSGGDGGPGDHRLERRELKAFRTALKHTVDDGSGNARLPGNRAAHPQPGVREVLHLLPEDLRVLLVARRRLDDVVDLVVAVTQDPEVRHPDAQLPDAGELVKIVRHLAVERQASQQDQRCRPAGSVLRGSLVSGPGAHWSISIRFSSSRVERV